MVGRDPLGTWALARGAEAVSGEAGDWGGRGRAGRGRAEAGQGMDLSAVSSGRCCVLCVVRCVLCVVLCVLSIATKRVMGYPPPHPPVCGAATSVWLRLLPASALCSELCEQQKSRY
jgi:hypothetical protein